MTFLKHKNEIFFLKHKNEKEIFFGIFVNMFLVNRCEEEKKSRLDFKVFPIFGLNWSSVLIFTPFSSLFIHSIRIVI